MPDSVMSDDSLGAAPRRAWLRAPDGAGWWRFTAPRGGWVAWETEEVPALLAAVEEAAEGVAGSGRSATSPTRRRRVSTRRSRAPGGRGSARGLRAFPAAGARRATCRRRAGQGPRVGRSRRRRSRRSSTPPRSAPFARRSRAATPTRSNFTFPLRGRLLATPEELFLALAPGSGAPFASFLDLGERAVVSLSPELFFERDGGRLRMRPMKGTRPRGRFGGEDAALARGARNGREGPGGEPDDRRHGAQRPRPGGAAGLRAGGEPLRRRALSDGLADDLDGRGRERGRACRSSSLPSSPAPR